MKTLLILRGAPACGKSTWIRENGLTPYTVSSDEIRLELSGVVLTTSGKLGIDQSKGKQVWTEFFNRVEARMDEGQFIVADATHTKPSDFKRYKGLVDQYGYKAYCVDFSFVDVTTCLKRNAGREEYKFVPENIIQKFHDNSRTTKVPDWATVVTPNELQRVFDETVNKVDLSQYDKVHHIGDIHGALEPLEEYFADGVKDNEAYVFIGDFIDRGCDSYEVLEFIISIADKPNVFLIRGNHDVYWYQWSKGNDFLTDNMSGSHEEFEFNTRLEIEGKIAKAGRDLGEVKASYRKLNALLRDVLIYTHGKKTVIATHGGVSGIPSNPALVSAKQYMKGVGFYKQTQDCYDSFNATAKNEYMVHGHRNILKHDIRNGNCFNLEQKIEFGGYLAIAVLTADGWETHKIQNKKLRADIKPLPWFK